MVYIKTWLLFTRVILAYMLAPSSFSKYSLAGKRLFSKSFRYSKKGQSSFRFYLGSYIRSIKTKRIVLEDSCHQYSVGGLYFYDANFSVTFEKEKISHLTYFLGASPNGSIWKDKLLGYFKLKDKLFQIIFETILFIILLPVTLFAKYIGSVGLIFNEYIELVNLIKIVKKTKVEVLYYYSIYEKDSNISSIALQNENVKVIKVTSLTPLKFWNSIIVAADELILSDVNQYEELSVFEDTILVESVKVWGPETIGETAKYYDDSNKYDRNKNVIGFYSTASYLRALKGDIEQNNMEANENKVKMYLAEYLRNHRSIKLIIFPHPREKKEEFKRIVSEHYKSFFDGIEYVIYDNGLQSSQCFDVVDLGVAMYSSVIYERLYYGFKCLMMPFGEAGFELPGKAINNICSTSKDDFFEKIDTFLKLSVVEYFAETNLEKSDFVREILQEKK